MDSDLQFKLNFDDFLAGLSSPELSSIKERKRKPYKKRKLKEEQEGLKLPSINPVFK